jgi:hypothetical protein
MTRNKWVLHRAEKYDKMTTHRALCVPFRDAIDRANKDADALEAAGVAPWKADPAKDDGEAVALLREFLAWHEVQTNRSFFEIVADARAFLSRLDGKGGAK